MERFKKKVLDPKDYRKIEILADITRIVLWPVFLGMKIWDWIFDRDH